MMTGAEGSVQALSLRTFLRSELAIRPGRVAAVTRISVCCTAIVVLWMIFRIPAPAYAAYIVFLVSRGETAGTLMTAIGGALAATLAIILTLVLYTLDAGEPALRLPLMTGATFLGMYLSRTIAIGPIAFLAGFVLVVTQTLIDDVPDLDSLTHLILWLWLVVMVPATLVTLVDLLVGQDPAQLARRNAAQLLDAVAQSLRRADASAVRALEDAPVALAELRHRAELLDRSLHGRSSIDMSLIEALDELMRMAALLTPAAGSDARAVLASACEACRDAVAAGGPPRRVPAMPSPALLQSLNATDRPIVVALANALDRLAARLIERQRASSAVRERPTAKSFFVADAFSNPEHVRFALKATLAAMATYIIYTGVDWSGIRTALITCFFVALGSVGETVHKLTLRLSGALAGGLIGGLCIVYLLPHLSDIGQLAILIAVVAALCAWVATSSELLAYAGMQMAFAFFVIVLQGYGPADDLTVLRDRIAGIVLGNVTMSLVFSTVWPVSAAGLARKAVADALSALAALVGRPVDSTTASGLTVARAMGRARQLVLLSGFELGLVPGLGPQRTSEQRVLDVVEPLAAAAYVVVNQKNESGGEAAARTRNEAAAWLDSYARALRSESPPPPAPSDSEVRARIAALPPESPLVMRSTGEAQALLLAKIRDVTSGR